LLFVEPDIFEAPAVVYAVGHYGEPLHLWPPGTAAVIDDRPRSILGQFSFDLPDQLLAFLLIYLNRLRGNHLIELGIAVAGHVALGTARKTLIKILVWVVDSVPKDTKANRVVLAEELG
jgi:hypothetical protein